MLSSTIIRLLAGKNKKWKISFSVQIFFKMLFFDTAAVQCEITRCKTKCSFHPQIPAASDQTAIDTCKAKAAPLEVKTSPLAPPSLLQSIFFLLTIIFCAACSIFTLLFIQLQDIWAFFPLFYLKLKRAAINKDI